MKRYLALALGLFLIACAHKSSTPNQLGSDQADNERYLKLVIVGTNDVHGYLRPKEEEVAGEKIVSGGAEWFAGYIRILEHKYGDHLILLDGGDIFQGTLESNTWHGRPMIEYYNLLPYRAAAIGNHEFDYGPETKDSKDRLGALKARIREAKFPFLSANTLDRHTHKPFKTKNLYPSTMFTIDGVKVGVIGLTTESTPQKTRPQNVQSLEFASLLDTTKKEAAKLRSQGADIVLITAHEGGNLLWEPMPQLLSALPKGTIDAVVSGHTHTKINEFIAGVPVIQSYTQGQYFGRIDLYVDRETKKVDTKLTHIHETISICARYFNSEDKCNARAAREAIAKDPNAKGRFFPLREATYEGETVEPDLAVHTVLAPYIAQTEEIRSRVVAHASRDFEKLPTGETETGDMLTDALRLAYPEARVAYYNGGGIRRMLLKGPVTYGDMFEVMPFDNMVVLAKVHGKDLRHMMEIGTAGEQMIPAVSGVRFSYDNSEKPSFDRDLNNDGKKDRWERNRLKSLVWDNGKPVQDKDEFWLVTNDYLVAGGDRLGYVFDHFPRSRVKVQDASLLDAVVKQLPTLEKRGFPENYKPRTLVVH